jgi:hypothetical protein|tara:strand:+ start:245 stop:697 length:453 start_codon:yes stop_codon:yes gene_type:complete
MAIKDFINNFRDEIRKPEKATVNPKWDANYVQLTTLQVLKLLIINKLILRNDGPEKIHELSEKAKQKKLKSDPHYNPAPPEIAVYTMAMVIGDEVADVMRVDEKMADYLLLRPEFIVFSPSEIAVKPKDKYINGEFVIANEKEKTDTEPS